MTANRIYLNVPFAEAASVKKLGATYDAAEKGWWIADNTDRAAFLRWLPRMYRPGLSPPHLTCDMVPANTWFLNLRKWLPQNEWDRIRKSVYQRAGYRCLVCGGKGPKWPVECNEQWQYLCDPSTPKMGTQKLLRLAALCPTCHSVKHAGYANLKGRLDDTLAHLGFVNGWNKAQCEEHFDAAAETHRQRSETTWTFDLSHLQSYDVGTVVIDLKKHSGVPLITGLHLLYRNISVAFNAMAAPFVNQRLASKAKGFWPSAKWQRLANECPVSFLNVVHKDGRKIQLIDCTTPCSFTDEHIDTIRSHVADAVDGNCLAMIFSVNNHVYENDVAISEAIDVTHPC